MIRESSDDEKLYYAEECGFSLLFIFLYCETATFIIFLRCAASMISVKKLFDDASLQDLLINQAYLAEVKRHVLYLAPEVKTPFEHRDGILPVKITMISSTGFTFQKIDDEYTVEVEKPRAGFLISHPHLDALQTDIMKAVKMIKDAVFYRDLILIRHHADTDGYCAGIALEEALIPLVSEQQEKYWYTLKRFPTRIPFYDYSDALRDLGLVAEQVSMKKKPLVIVCDNGSGE